MRVGAPYLEIELNRENMARYGVNVEDLQEILSAAVGGMVLTRTVEGRERFPVRLRYARELRDNPEALGMILVPIATGAQVPLKELADINYTRGAQMIQSENTFLVGYVIFDKLAGKAEVDIVKEASRILEQQIKEGELNLDPGVSYKFAGQLRAAGACHQPADDRRSPRLVDRPAGSILSIQDGHCLTDPFLRGVRGLRRRFYLAMALRTGLVHELLHRRREYAGSFPDAHDQSERGVWVGFIALFGVATDDGVLMGTYHIMYSSSETPAPSTISGKR